MIYSVYKEEVEKFKVQDKRIIHAKDKNSPEEMSFASGNIFESMAKTNPELFNRAKLTQMLSSKNIVHDFNLYISNIFMDNINKFISFAQTDKKKEDSNIVPKFYESFNTTLFVSMTNDLNIFINEYEMTIEEALKAIRDMYLPESLTEEGCRKLISIRLENNKLLTDSLIKMLKLNYMALGIGEAEACQLIKNLKNDNTNHEAIEWIKTFLNKPKELEKFKIGKYNYDFRPIGGGCLFLSSDPSIQFSSHPSRNLSRIFQYDAIVIGHGTYSPGTSQYTKDDIERGISYILNELKDQIKYIRRKILLKSSTASNNKERDTIDLMIYAFYIIEKNVLEFANKNKTNYDENFNNKFKENCRKTRNLLASYSKKYDENIFDNEIQSGFENVYNILNKLINNIIASENPKQAIKDGKSTEWRVEPIDTLSTTDNERMIDILRALKREGFKNVFIGACNSGNVKLPKDIEEDKDFKVHMGTATVYLESSLLDDETYIEMNNIELQLESYLEECNSYYRFYSLNELYKEFDKIQNDYILNEGALDAIKIFCKKAVEIVVSIWRYIVSFFKDLYIKIKEFILKKFGDKDGTRLNKSIEVNTITINGKFATLSKINTNTPEDIKNTILQANAGISDFIKQNSSKETDWIRRMENMINSGKFKKKDSESNKMKQESCGIFEYVRFLDEI